MCRVGGTFDAVEFIADEVGPDRWRILMQNKYESENVWVWARDVLNDEK